MHNDIRLLTKSPRSNINQWVVLYICFTYTIYVTNNEAINPPE